MIRFLRHPVAEFAAIALALVVFLLFAVPVKAAEYFPVKTYHNTYTSTAQAVTEATISPVVRLTCTTACYYALATTTANSTSASSILASAQSINATSTTTHYLPADVPVEHNAGRGVFLLIIQVSSSGIFHFTELSR